MKIGMNIDAVKGIFQKEYIKLMADLGFEATFSGDKDEAYHYALANDLAEFGIEYETVHAPFDGKMDFDRVVNHIRKSGFDGTLMLEVFAKHKMYENMPPEEFLTRAAEAVKKLKSMVRA